MFQNQGSAITPDQQGHHQQPGQGTPSPLSPTPSPAGSVGSVGSQSSGYNSGELASRGSNPPLPSAHTQNAGAWVPLSVFNAMTKQNEQFTYLLSYQDLWDTADSLVINGKQTGQYSTQINLVIYPVTLHLSTCEAQPLLEWKGRRSEKIFQNNLKRYLLKPKRKRK